MENPVLGNGAGNTFKMSATLTVACGVAFVAMVMWWLKPAPQAVNAQPEVKIVERIVERPSTERPQIQPFSPPMASQPVAPPAPRVAVEKRPPSKWEGKWQIPDRPLPLFQITQAGDSLMGKYYAAPSIPGAVPSPCEFTDGQVNGDEATFTVQDKAQRFYVRMRLRGSGVAVIESMQKIEEIMEVLQNPRVNMMERYQLQGAIRTANKWLPAGMFRREQ
jgi:hypothetical protein